MLSFITVAIIMVSLHRINTLTKTILNISVLQFNFSCLYMQTSCTSLNSELGNSWDYGVDPVTSSVSMVGRKGYVVDRQWPLSVMAADLSALLWQASRYSVMHLQSSLRPTWAMQGDMKTNSIHHSMSIWLLAALEAGSTILTSFKVNGKSYVQAT